MFSKETLLSAAGLALLAEGAFYLANYLFASRYPKPDEWQVIWFPDYASVNDSLVSSLEGRSRAIESDCIMGNVESRCGDAEFPTKTLKKSSLSVKKIGLDVNSPFQRLQDILKDAKHSLNVCMFCWTSGQLANIIIDAYKRGLIVHIITDYDQTGQPNSQISRLRISGIPLRHNAGRYLMHHKFAIIDGQVLITGSSNWTNQAVVGNYENLFITRQPGIVREYQAQFQKLWLEFKPARC